MWPRRLAVFGFARHGIPPVVFLRAVHFPASAVRRPTARGLVEWGVCEPVLRHSFRAMACKTDAKSFESEVIQSQQAVILVYYIPNASCNAYLKQVEELVSRMNRQASSTWLKLCIVNSDENRNLASAFSVQRAQLPVTFFIMQATNIDKVVGHISEARLEAILEKFLEHYQSQLNIDLSSGTNRKDGSPMAGAVSTDLLHGATTQFLQTRILSSLVGAGMIQLPEESPQLDGLRKTIQQAKKKAYDELQELHRDIGIDVRRLSDSEMESKYYRSSQFMAYALLSALEALYLARVHATIGEISAENVIFALNAIHKDFERALGDPTVKRVVALCEVNLIKAEAKIELLKWERMLVDDSSPTAAEDRSTRESALEHYRTVLSWIDQVIDTRSVQDSFPSGAADEMLAALRRAQALQKKVRDGKRRVEQLKTCAMSLVQQYPSDPKSIATRSRIMSVLY